MKWVGPYTIDELLDGCLDPSHPKPPEDMSVYIITKVSWEDEPNIESHPLYVGSNTGKSKRFKIRIGDLIADIFGFFGPKKGHHSGGRTLHEYCLNNNLKPKKLFIGWAESVKCKRCAENYFYEKFKTTLLNKDKPSGCKEHNNLKI